MIAASILFERSSGEKGCEITDEGVKAGGNRSAQVPSFSTIRKTRFHLVMDAFNEAERHPEGFKDFDGKKNGA